MQVISELSKRVEPRRQLERRDVAPFSWALTYVKVPHTRTKANQSQTCQFISDYAGKRLLVSTNWNTRSGGSVPHTSIEGLFLVVCTGRGERGDRSNFTSPASQFGRTWDAQRGRKPYIQSLTSHMVYDSHIVQ